ncbi:MULTISPECIES: DUF7683 domain-containing protein [unclassified Pseudomonas]|uniref:DUF7683 domain-containing protein n=1 Tax=unclassified Pseudomonas TaxID=196821 RepID=UPI00215C5B5D|nr:MULTISPECIES: hypothetical protein [unclassified Pseudomonas]MCR8932680.1 hypothetical protein [Pseudomonas sp. S11A4]MCR8976284.1 hypothetical protein [Pseudomonas sp. S11P7]
MKHVVEVFDRKTESLLRTVEIEARHKKALKELMNWQKPEDEFDGNDLTEEQITTLEKWTGQKLLNVNHIVQLVCVE